jgi:class 3 adenylate cyclase
LWQEGKKTAAESHGKLLEVLRDFSGRVKKRSMADAPTVHFGPYRLDPANARLWQGTQPLRLTPKAFQVLCYFVDHPGQLVTKDDLFAAAWPETVISDATLASCIQEVRQTLGDDAKQPRYIETVHRRGYRFIAPLSTLPSQTLLPHETEHQQGEAVGRNVTRKLAALLGADVQGYSRLMGQDEVGTIRTLTTYRALMTECIAQYGGRVVDAPGDNLLAEFASAVAAVQCAVVIQQTLGAKNAALPAAQQLAFRMGLNVGDVIVEGEQLYGDGVNIAARLEGLAEGGGLCISGTVYDQVKSKVVLGYEYLGEQRVKNIAEPVRVYRVRWAEEGTESTAASLEAKRQDSGGKREEELQTSLQSEASGHFHPVPLLIGRDLELAQLQGWLATALNGQRQIVFVMGEAGIGKTTLVDAFLRGIGHGELDVGSFPLSSPNPKAQIPVPGAWMGYGQCIEQYGAGEPYMPLLQALGRLCREPGGDRLITLLNQHAPTWLVQLPTLLTASELETLQRKVQGATRKRMLREMTEAVDAIT